MELERVQWESSHRGAKADEVGAWPPCALACLHPSPPSCRLSAHGYMQLAGIWAAPRKALRTHVRLPQTEAALSRALEERSEVSRTWQARMEEHRAKWAKDRTRVRAGRGGRDRGLARWAGSAHRVAWPRNRLWYPTRDLTSC
jgi:hypothetical protein